MGGDLNLRVLWLVLLLLSLVFVLSAAPLELTSVEFAEMNSWEKKGPADQSNWQVQAGGRTVKQTVNGKPAFFVTTKDYMNVTIMGTIQVATTADDDMIGLVVGYQDPAIAPAVNQAMDYNMILFDWKQANQNFGGLTSNKGYGLHQLAGNINTGLSNNNYFWLHTQHTDQPTSGSFNLLASDYGAAGWKDNTEYNFRIIHTSTKVKIRINNVLIFDHTITVPGGKVGFYNHSQTDVIYGNVRLAPSSDTPQPPVAIADVYGTSTNTALSINMLNGLVSNDYDPNLDIFRINVESSGNYTGSYTGDDELKYFQTSHGNIALAGNGQFIYTPQNNYEGIDTFTYSLTDNYTTVPDGTSSNVIVSIAVVANNAAPTDITLSDNIVNQYGENTNLVGYLNTVDADAADLHDYVLISQSTNTLFYLSGNALRIFDASKIGPAGNTHSIQVKSTDANGLSFTKTLYLIVKDLRPTLTQWTISGNYVENQVPLNIDTSLSITDANDTHLLGANVQISANLQSLDLLAVTSLGNVTSSYNATTGLLAMSGNDTLDNYRQVLQTLTFVNQGDNPTFYGSANLRQLEVLLYDSAGNSALNRNELEVVGINDIPSMANISSSANYVEQAVAVTVDSNINLSDVDDLTLASANVLISALGLVSDTLSVNTTGTPISSSFDANLMLLSLTGTANILQYQNVLESLNYQNSSDNPDDYQTKTSRTLLYTIVDLAGGSNTQSTSILISAVNDAPLLSGYDQQPTYTEQGAAVQLDANLSLSDADDLLIQSANVAISANFLSGDTLSVNVALGTVSSNFDSSLGLLSLSGAANISAYQSLLQSIIFSSTSDNPDEYGQKKQRLLTMTIHDHALSSSNTSSLSITAVNDAPLLSDLSASGAFNEQGTALTIDGNITLFDVDDLQLSGANVTISSNGMFEDLLAVSIGATGITSTYDSTNHLLRLSGAASLLSYETVLETLTFTHSSVNPTDFGSKNVRHLNYVIYDLAGASAQQSTSFSVVGLNSPPSLGGLDQTASFTEGGSAVIVDGLISVDDVDHVLMSGANVSISGNFVNGDQLSVQLGANALVSSYQTSTGILTITGSASNIVYEHVLESLSLSSSSDNPDAYGAKAQRSLTYEVYDALGASGNGTLSVNILAVNDLPVLAWSSNVFSYTENADWLSMGLEIAINDVDDTHLKGANLLVSANYIFGDEWVLTNSSSNIQVLGFDTNAKTVALTGRSSLADYALLMQSLQFRHNGENPNPNGDQRSTHLQWTIYDDHDGQAQAVAELQVQEVNDAPSLSKIQNAQVGFAENGPAVVLDSDLEIQDVDHLYLQKAVVQILNVEASEKLQVSSSSNAFTILYDSTSGNLFISGNALLSDYRSVLRQVTYENLSANPTLFSSRTSRSVQFSVFDGVDWSAEEMLSLTLTPFNDAPRCVLSAANLSYIEQTPLTLDANLSLSDVDDLNLNFAEVSISANFQTGDILSVNSNTSLQVTYDALLGRLTLQGLASLATYQEVLSEVTFDVQGDNPDHYGAQKFREIQWKVYDGSTWSPVVKQDLSIVAVNDPPVLSTPVLTQFGFAEGGNPSQVWPGLSISDPDDLQLSSANIVITNVEASDILAAQSISAAVNVQYDVSTGLLQFTGLASIDDFQKTMRSATYASNSLNPTFYNTKKTRSLQVEVKDASDLSSGKKDLSVLLSPSNNRPEVLFFSGSVDYKEDSSAVWVDRDLITRDIDDLNLQQVLVYFVGPFHPQDQLLLTVSDPALSVVFDSALGRLTLTGNASLQAYQTVLRSLQFENTSDEPTLAGLAPTRTIQVVGSDGTTWSYAENASIGVFGTNDAPVVAGLASLNYQEQQGSLNIFPNVLLSDIDGISLQQAWVQLSPSLDGDVLSCLTGAGLSCTVDANLTSLQIKGLGSIQSYQDVVRSITVKNDSDNPDVYGTQWTRSVKLAVYDGESWSVSGNFDLNITAINDPPTVSRVGGLESYQLSVGSVWQQAYAVSDPDDLVLTTTLVEAPAGISLLTSNNLMLGTIQTSAAGYHQSLQLQTLDPGGLSSKLSIPIQISSTTLEVVQGSKMTWVKIKLVDEAGQVLINARVQLWGNLTLNTDQDGIVQYWVPRDQNTPFHLSFSSANYSSLNVQQTLLLEQVNVFVLKKRSVRLHGQVLLNGIALAGADVVAYESTRGTFSTTTDAMGGFEIWVDEATGMESWQMGAHRLGDQFKVVTFDLAPGTLDKAIDLNAFDLTQETLFGYEVHQSNNFDTDHTYHVTVRSEPNFTNGDENNLNLQGLSSSLVTQLRYNSELKAIQFDVQWPLEDLGKTATFSLNASPLNALPGSTEIVFKTDSASINSEHTEAKVQQMVNVVRGGHADLSSEFILNDQGQSIKDQSGFEIPPFGISSEVRFIKMERTGLRIPHFEDSDFLGAIYSVEAYQVIDTNGQKTVHLLTNTSYINKVYLTFEFDATEWTPYKDRIYYSQNQGYSWTLFPDSDIVFIDHDKTLVTIVSTLLSLWVLGEPGQGLIGSAGGGSGGGCLLWKKETRGSKKLIDIHSHANKE